jgi:3D (Asp-Asp-Asp) domain-containing protein
MPDLKISELPAVVTPAATDQFAVNQGGVSRMETRAQIHTLESGEAFAAGFGLLTVVFGDGNTGFGEFSSDVLNLEIGGVNRWRWLTGDYSGTTGGSASIRGATVATVTAPTLIPAGGDTDTGIGADAVGGDQLSLIAGGVAGLRLAEASSRIIQTPDANVGLTADVGSGQGDGVILCSYNVYSTVATAGDAATLPAVFPVGTVIFVKNDGANRMDVFPASGDDAGAGADVAIVVDAGDSAWFLATAADATWTQISLPLVQNRLVLPLTNDAANPTLAFGDGDTGFFEVLDDIMRLSMAGVARWIFQGDNISGVAGSSARISNLSTSNTVPNLLPNQADPNTGIGANAADVDQLALIAGGVEGMRLTEASSFVIQSPDANVGLTADPSSVQGGGVILCSYNVYSTVATIGDAATLPAVFKVGTKVWVKNDAANSMDVFPASGDDAGGGTDVAVAVAGGATALFIATVADATWSQLI